MTSSSELPPGVSASLLDEVVADTMPSGLDRTTSEDEFVDQTLSWLVEWYQQHDLKNATDQPPCAFFLHEASAETEWANLGEKKTGFALAFPKNIGGGSYHCNVNMRLVRFQKKENWKDGTDVLSYIETTVETTEDFTAVVLLPEQHSILLHKKR